MSSSSLVLVKCVLNMLLRSVEYMHIISFMAMGKMQMCGFADVAVSVISELRCQMCTSALYT